jgi:thiamine-monophosphate kinase
VSSKARPSRITLTRQRYRSRGQPGLARCGPASWRCAITVADLGEFGLIAAIQALLPPDKALQVGAGDDAAVVRVPGGRVVATTDVLVEGNHFRRDWSSAADVGVKAAAQNLADVAAMGAWPTTLLVGLACPAGLAADWVLEMIGGMVAEARRAGASIAGGDVTAADRIMLGVTALGELIDAEPVTRAGARPGDQVAVAGRIGWSAAGLALLQAGLPDDTAGVPGVGRRGSPVADLAAVVGAYRRPQPPYSAGPAAAKAGATGMVDVSDGLLADLGHVAEASGVRIDVSSALLPAAGPVAAAARVLGTDCLDWILTGGEDHALAATFPPHVSPPDGWTVIGGVSAGDGVLVDGSARRGPGGFDHFR